MAAGLRDTDLCIICVGTPTSDDSTSDLTSVWQVADEIKRPVILAKCCLSTVPVGTTRALSLAMSNEKVSFVLNF